ncbi:Txe/YoeB family addiction module toxin [Shinella oryzae]|uniref:Putative mRNA interferase YoeB n=1 Tax=Shinella oryzae TaxID=2871820 RepID=A0ABY9K2S3_9HYPH|nr:Txe/YoeB family addiction module toxin [Shinella oryzae]WLS01936.1 Txe/YoeB family addiction module toxin [Shinella oryzae]
MKICFSPEAWADFTYWTETDRRTVEKIVALIKECRRDPFSGLGKPEPLRGELKGFWSRRITQEHRLVYRVTGSGAAQVLEIAACRYHYS